MNLCEGFMAMGGKWKKREESTFVMGKKFCSELTISIVTKGVWGWIGPVVNQKATGCHPVLFNFSDTRRWTE